MRYIALFAATALTFGVVGCNKEEAQQAGQKTEDAAHRAADATGDAVTAAGKGIENASDAVVGEVAPSGTGDVTGMRNAIEGVVQNALDADNFTTMTNHFSDADQKRLEANAPATDDLDAQIGQFKEMWKNKYGGDVFTVMDADTVFTPEFAALKSMKGANDQLSGTVTIAESHGLAKLEVPMVGEDGKWRVDVPDDMNASQLRANLVEAVKELNAKSSEWPADKTEAMRHVSHRIMLAVLDE